MTQLLRLGAIVVIAAISALPAYSADDEKSLSRVGHKYPRSEPWGKHFYEGLREEGFVDGQNVVVTTSKVSR